jgi:hypothetical protein
VVQSKTPTDKRKVDPPAPLFVLCTHPMKDVPFGAAHAPRSLGRSL